MLLLVQFLEIREGVLIVGVEAQHFGERFEGPVDEATTLVVEAEAEQNVGVFELAQVGTLEQFLVFLDGSSDLAFFAVQVAEDQVNLERIARGGCRARQLVDRRIGLIRDQEVEAKHVVRRLARASAVDPLALAQFVPLVSLADRQAGEQGDERTQQYERSCPSRLGEMLAQHVVPSLLRPEYQFDELAHRAASSAGGADPMHALAHLWRSVGGRGR